MAGWGCIGGGGGETRSGTEKRWSHNLQSGDVALWSVDNCSIFVGTSYMIPIVYRDIENIMAFCPLVLKLQNPSDSHCNIVFLTDNKARWAINQVYSLRLFP